MFFDLYCFVLCVFGFVVFFVLMGFFKFVLYLFCIGMCFRICFVLQCFFGFVLYLFCISVCFGICTVQHLREERRVIILVKLKHFMIM